MEFFLGWIGLGLIGSGWLYALLQGISTANKRDDAGFAILFALLGPITLVAGFLITGFGRHGWWGWKPRKGGE